MSVSPLGLPFAAILAFFLAIGEVCNKKVVEGQQVAAVFWIRIFCCRRIRGRFASLYFQGRAASNVNAEAGELMIVSFSAGHARKHLAVVPRKRFR